MINIEQFKNNIVWTEFNFSDEQLKIILNSVNTDYSTLDEIAESLELQGYTDPNDYNPFPYFYGVNLSSVIEYFEELSEAQIIEFIQNENKGIDLYYLKDDDLYLAMYELI